MDIPDHTPVALVLDTADVRALLSLAVDALERPDGNDDERGVLLSAACQLAQALRQETPDRMLPSPDTRAVGPRATRTPTAPPHDRTASDLAGGGTALGAALLMAKVSRPVPRTASRVVVPGWLLAELVEFALSHYEMGA